MIPTLLGGLATLMALLLLRNRLRSAKPPDVMVIHAEPIYDTPALHHPRRESRMIVVPFPL